MGTIRKDKNITIIKNPETPIYRKDIFSFEEDLQIGTNDKGKEYIFSRINSFEVDEKGNIYILDDAAAEIRVFDEKGQYLMSIGKKGQGPGEMQKGIFIHLTPNNELLVQDYSTQRFIYFSLDGQYLRQKLYMKRSYPFLVAGIDQQENIIGLEILAPFPIGGRILKKFDSNLEPIMTIAEEPQNKNLKSDELNVVRPSLCLDVFNNGNIVFGNSEKYELNIIDSQGILIRKIIKKHSRLRITAEDRDSYKKEYSDLIERGVKLNFPDYFPCFSDVAVDDAGMIYVKTYDRKKEVKSFSYDVFDSEGKYLTKMSIGLNLNRSSIWKKDRLYTVDTDKNGFQILKRFKINKIIDL